VGEVALELHAQHLLGRRLDVVLDALELEALRLGVEERVAGAVVVVARLAHRADAHDVLAVGLEHEVFFGQLFDVVGGEREDLAEVRVADEREVAEVFPHAEALARLLGGEDVLELFEPHRRAVAQVHVDVVELLHVGEPAQPTHVLGRQHARVGVEGVARGLVVIRVVHAAGDGGVVVAQDGRPRQRAHHVGALVGRPPVAHRVTEAVERIDPFVLVRLYHGRKRLVVGVNVAKNAEAHWDPDTIPPHR
jgi:hypothetical protein